MNETNLFLFCLVAIPLILTPGPDIIYVLTRGITQGRKIALISMAGVCTGYLGHTIFAVLGLSALINSSEILFNFIKFIGGLYLIYLGIQAIKTNGEFQLSNDEHITTQPYKLFMTGMIISLMNPKAILFFFAFLPQFIVPSNGNIHLQLFTLGFIFTFFCILIYSFLAVSSSVIGYHLSSSRKVMNIFKYLTGSILVGLGFKLIVSEKE